MNNISDFNPENTAEVVPAHIRTELQFIENAAEIGQDPSTPTLADLERERHQQGVAGWNGGEYTAVSGKKENYDAKLAAKKTVSQASASVNATDDIRSTIGGLTNTFVTSARGFLLNEEGQEATIKDKIGMENDAKQNIITKTAEEQAIQDYMTGETDQVPEILEQIAEQHGVKNPSGEPLERADYEQIIKSEFPAHVSDRLIEGEVTDVENGQDLLPTAPEVTKAVVQAPLSAPTVG